MCVYFVRAVGVYVSVHVFVAHTSPVPLLMGEYSRQRYSPKVSTMRQRSILIINPNSTESMTDALKPLVEELHFKDVNDRHYRTSYGRLTKANRQSMSSSQRPPGPRA
jgi:hypothetical protein